MKGKSNQSKEGIAERERRVALIQPLVTEGLKPAQISHRIGLNPDVVRHIIRRYCKRPDGYYKYGRNENMMDWQSEVDPSHLTPEQREHAKRLNMTEGRYAWVMACPRDIVGHRPNVGHRGGNTIG